MSMGIELITDSETIAVDEKNFSESLQKLENALKSGELVYIQNYRGDDLSSIGIDRHSTITLFFSDGKKEGKFLMKKGQKNYSYIHSSNNNLESYKIITQFNDNVLDNIKITMPHGWTNEQYNEGTFSPAGGTSWISRHSAGTDKIIVGNKLIEMFPEAIAALKFAQDAEHFILPSPYAQNNHVIFKEGDNIHRNDYNIAEIKKDFEKLPDIISSYEDKRKYLDLRKKITVGQEDMRKSETHEIACVNAVLNLLEQPVQDSSKFISHLEAVEVGLYTHGVESIRKQGFPVDSKDYIIKELQHPSRTIAFVKVGMGSYYGETFVLPAKNMDAIVIYALSKENIKTYYPQGLRE